MSPHIESISVDLFDGRFSGVVRLAEGFNIVSGENGTGKSKLLELLKQRKGVQFAGDNKTGNIVAFNPKRNAQKHQLLKLIRQMRSQGVTNESIRKTLRDIEFSDVNVSTYPSFPELFIMTYESIVDEGTTTKTDAIKKVENEFNLALRRVFPEYRLSAALDNRVLRMEIHRPENTFDVHNMSCGESEVFSLMFNIFANRQDQDIFLIDEPEMHLNWKLENGLFTFLAWFCGTYGKQVIAATHSRAIFSVELDANVQFLVWESGRIEVKSEVSDELKKDIAGDAVRTIVSLGGSEGNVFVEDDAHEVTVSELASVLGRDVVVNRVTGGSSVVKNLCRAMREFGESESLFLIDGDNQGLDADLVGYDRIVHLKKYCVENYYLDTRVMCAMFPDRTKAQMDALIAEKIKALPKDSKHLVFIRVAESGLMNSDVVDTFDASKILKNVASALGITDKRDYMRRYVAKAQELGLLTELFAEIISKL